MMYEVFSYHGSNTYPVGNIEDNIFGIELEIDDFSETTAEILDMMIEDDILTSPENEHRTRNLKKIERDSSVYREIILRADTIENIKERLTVLDDYLCGAIDNSTGTSCHIHMNRNYLEDMGITERNIFKMFEFFAPVIYKISGRSRSSMAEWAEPRSHVNFRDLSCIDWEMRAENLQGLRPSSGRYTMVNCTNPATIELRAFSNYYCFDSRYTVCYLEFVNLCISLAQYMVGKYYNKEYPVLIHAMETFFKERHSFIYQKFNLAQMFRFNPMQKLFKAQFIQFKNQTAYPRDFLHHFQYDGNNTFPFDVLRTAYNYKKISDKPTYKVTLTPQGVKNLSKQIITDSSKDLMSYAMLFYRSLNHEEQTGGI